MVKVTLKSYLKRACPKVVPAEIDALVEGVAELAEMPSVKEYAKDILTALFKAKILDPACGSGAFPMGIMSAMVEILRTVDPDNKHWYEIVLKESLDEAASIADVGDEQERSVLKTQIEYDFNERVDHPDYARKLYIIEHCIFGSDIQPIAVQISRLRFFITLLCEQTKNDDPTKNYGITPLPNLESNFVAANSLLSIDLKDMRELLGQKKIVSLVKQLRSIRHQLFLPKTSDKKKRLQKKDEELRDAISAAAEELYDENIKQMCAMLEADIRRCDEELAKLGEDDFKDVMQEVEEVDLFGEKTVTTKTIVGKGNAIAKRKAEAETSIASLKNASRKERLLTDLKRLVAWNPFAFNVAEAFLDPEWMFGVKDGFDVVIGNPPYIQLQANGGLLANFYVDKGFEAFDRMGDLYCLFYERGNKLVHKNGAMCYITSDKWMRNGYGEKLRNYLIANSDCRLLIDFDDLQIFEAATVETNILLSLRQASKVCSPSCCSIRELNSSSLEEQVELKAQNCVFDIGKSWTITSPIEGRIKDKVEAKGLQIKQWNVRLFRGILTGYNPAFLIDDQKRDEIISKDAKADAIIKPVLRGKDIKRYYCTQTMWLIDSHNGVRNKINRIDINDYPSVKEHLDMFQSALVKRGDKGDTPYNLRDCAYWEDLSKPKIVWGELSDRAKFVLSECYLLNTGFFMVGERLPYILGLLNSKLVAWYFSFIGTKSGMGTTRWLKYTIEQLPLVVPNQDQDDEISSRVNAILAAKKSDPSADTSALEVEIDEKVFDLYGLTPEEREIVKENGK